LRSTLALHRWVDEIDPKESLVQQHQSEQAILKTRQLRFFALPCDRFNYFLLLLLQLSCSQRYQNLFPSSLSNSDL
jgi:hypothetical protein